MEEAICEPASHRAEPPTPQREAPKCAKRKFPGIREFNREKILPNAARNAGNAADTGFFRFPTEAVETDNRE
jgi:hypothetical protein